MPSGIGNTDSAGNIESGDGSSTNDGGGGGGGDEGGGISGWGDLSLPGWLKTLKTVEDALITLANNPRRFVLGVLLSALVGYVVTALTLGINLTRWLAGFKIPGQITVDGDTVNVPWCSSASCDLFSFVDVPGYISGQVIGSFSPAGRQLLQGIGSIWTQIPSDLGLAGPFLLFGLGVAAVLAVYWLVRIIIGLSPISIP